MIKKRLIKKRLIKKRLNIQMSEELKKWCETESGNLGLSMSAFINMVLSNLKNSEPE